MDSVSLTLTIGPVVLKAATLMKLCRDIQAKLLSTPGTLSAIALECTEIHQLLESFKAIGRRDFSQLGVDKTKEFSHAIGSVRKCFSMVLTSIEQHVEALEESIEASLDGETHPVSQGKDFQWEEDEVQKILDESKQHRDNFTSLLKDLQLSIEPQISNLPKEEAESPEVPIISEPRTTPPQESQPNNSRFSIDSTATHDFAINPSRFSTDSLSSILSATHFDFDTEALASPSYRQAFSERVRNIISRPLNSPGDAALLRAIEPLEGEGHYYEQSLEIEWDPSISGSTILSDGTASSRSSLRTVESQVTVTGTLTMRRQRIGHPVNPVHVTHIGLDPVTGEFTGLPAEWRRILLAEDERARAAAAANNSGTTPSAGLTPASGNGNNKKMATIKLVVVGDSGKVKQCLLITYVTNKYPSEYVPQVFDNYAVTVMIGDDPYTLGIFDTTGQESFDRLRPLSYPQTDVFMIVISTSTPSHYKSARDTWAPELKHHCPGIPFLLVGIQDPPNDALDTASRKKARVEEGKKLARDIGAEKYVECELESGKGVKNVFDEAIVAALEPVVVPKKRRKSRLRLLARIEED